jgi:hypothetical protein
MHSVEKIGTVMMMITMIRMLTMMDAHVADLGKSYRENNDG